ncbi:MAG TPA: FAD-binding protein, partial [Vicinamibacterales bacterium]|nr:FAD-binding protein [Vicinamibacterales bacterium]
MSTVDTLIPTLEAIVGPSAVLTKPEDVVPYGFDGTAAIRTRPSVVVLPTTTAQVSACVKAAHDAGIPTVTRGSGTGLSGGS